MNEMSNKAENDKMFMSKNLKTASQIIEELEMDVTRLSSSNEKLSLALHFKENELEKAKANKREAEEQLERMENLLRREIDEKTLNLHEELVGLLNRFTQEKGEMEKMIKEVLEELEKLKESPGFSFRITILVKDIQSRLAKLEDVIEWLLRNNNDQERSRRGDSQASQAKTPERFIKTPNKSEKSSASRHYLETPEKEEDRRNFRNSSIKSNGKEIASSSWSVTNG